MAARTYNKEQEKSGITLSIAIDVHNGNGSWTECKIARVNRIHDIYEKTREENYLIVSQHATVRFTHENQKPVFLLHLSQKLL